MIISASRRTDIPAYYSDWFFRRLREGYALVRNPMNFHQVSRIDLSPEAVDCIVFWTKDPGPMLGRLGELAGYHYYFQFTLNPYGRDVEENVPPKDGRIVDTFRRLSASIGPEKVVWRYDPILFSRNYTPAYHAENFEKLAERLKGYTEKCTISFLDLYPSIKNDMASLGVREADRARQRDTARELSRIASRCGMRMDTCCEEIDLSGLGIGHARCIDGGLIARITGKPVRAAKDRNQRPACGCVPSADIGSYDTCLHGCKYCYACRSRAALQKNRLRYDAASPLLCGSLRPGDKVGERKR